jgi:glycopeptide antibiotics resistance protein
MVICLTLLSRDPGSRFEVRLETFRIFSSFDMDRTYAIENIIMFVPLGFMLPFLNRKFHSFKIIIFIGFIGSFAIEVSQYITKRGFTELDDILNNVVGIIIGYVIFSLAKVLHSYKQETL